jgi:hypothetical protein
MNEFGFGRRIWPLWRRGYWGATLIPFPPLLLLREADSVVIFPKAYNINTFNTLVNHFGMDKVLVKNLFSHKDEHFILLHVTMPMYLYFGTSMEKVDL